MDLCQKGSSVSSMASYIGLQAMGQMFWVNKGIEDYLLPLGLVADAPVKPPPYGHLQIQGNSNVLYTLKTDNMPSI